MMDIKKSTKKIEIPTIKTEIEITEQWYNELLAGIAEKKEKYGKDMNIGEYIETAVTGMANFMAIQARQIELLKAKEQLPPEQIGAMYG